jgi:hypothetical protein
MKNKQMKKWKDLLVFPPLLLIVNHLHKAMGEGRTSPWHIQHNKSTTMATLTMQ